MSSKSQPRSMFTMVGFSKANGQMKLRWSNDRVKGQSVLLCKGESDVMLFMLDQNNHPLSLSKLECVRALRHWAESLPDLTPEHIQLLDTYIEKNA